MRTLKFRGLSDNKMICGDLQHSIYKGPEFHHIITLGWPQIRYEVKIGTIGQFTGLTDKNGKEIYEGDLVKDFRGEINEIKYNEFCSFMLYPLKDKSKFFAIYPEIDLEVIGNIHQNPELL